MTDVNDVQTWPDMSQDTCTDVKGMNSEERGKFLAAYYDTKQKISVTKYFQAKEQLVYTLISLVNLMTPAVVFLSVLVVGLMWPSASSGDAVINGCMVIVFISTMVTNWKQTDAGRTLFLSWGKAFLSLALVFFAIGLTVGKDEAKQFMNFWFRFSRATT